MRQGLLFMFFLFAISGVVYSQVYRGEYDILFFGHEPSVASEATGKIYLVCNDDASSALYNPSYSALTNNIGVGYSQSKGYYILDNAKFTLFGFNVPIKETGNFSFSIRAFDFGNDVAITTVENPYGTGEYFHPKITNYNLNYSRKLFDNFYMGVGINYLNDYYAKEKHDFYSLNIGGSYFYNLIEDKAFSQDLFIGLAINNAILYSPNNEEKNLQPVGGKASTYKYMLPQISRWDIGYKLNYHNLNLIENANDISVMFQVEYSDVLNASDWSRISIGSEISIFEILKVRLGYFSMELLGGNKKEKFTNGWGVSIPLYLWMDLPIKIGVDYTQIQQPHSSFYSDTELICDAYAIYISYQLK